MDSNFNTAAGAADLRSMQTKPHRATKAWTFLRNAAFRAAPHSAPRRTILHHAALVPLDAAFVPQLL
jgi:hypothetical protein